MFEPPPGGSPTGSAGIGTVLRNRPFLFLWIAQFLSQTAQQMVNFTVLQQAYALSESNTAVSVVILCFTVPGILLSPLAGVLVERQPKRQVLWVTNAARAVTMLLFIFLTGPALPLGALSVVYVGTLVFAGISQFFVPAESSTIPLLVPRRQLVAANGLFNFTFTLTQLLGFLVLGPVAVRLLVQGTDFGSIYIIIGILYIACTGLTALLPRDSERQTSEPIAAGSRLRVAWEELREGWDYIRADRAIFTAIIQWSVAFALLFTFGVIGQSFLRLEVHLDPKDLYLVLLPGGVGLVAGVGLVNRFATPQNRIAMMNRALAGAGIAVLVLAALGGVIRTIVRLVEPHATAAQIDSTAQTPILVGLMAVVLVLGVLNSFIAVPAQTTLQERARVDIRARVFAAFYTIQNAIVAVAILIMGGLADAVGVVPTMAIVGGGVLIAAYWGIKHSPEVTPPPRHHEPEPLEPPVPPVPVPPAPPPEPAPPSREPDEARRG